MNLTLARQAEKDVNAGNAEQKSGYCLRGARQFDEHTAHGTKYDALFRGNGEERDATAARAAHRFLAAGLGFLRKDVLSHGGLQPGDLLFKTQVAPNRWGDFSGHVGVLCEDSERLAENSSTSVGRVHGALGFRTLAQFGDYDIVVRLPDPNAKVAEPAAGDKYFIQGVHEVEISGARIENGKLVGVIADAAFACGYKLTTRNDRRKERGRFDVRAVPETR